MDHDHRARVLQCHPSQQDRHEHRKYLNARWQDRISWGDVKRHLALRLLNIGFELRIQGSGFSVLGESIT